MVVSTQRSDGDLPVANRGPSKRATASPAASDCDGDAERSGSDGDLPVANRGPSKRAAAVRNGRKAKKGRKEADAAQKNELTRLLGVEKTTNGYLVTTVRSSKKKEKEALHSMRAERKARVRAEKALEKECAAHDRTRMALDEECTAHEKTQDALERERADHRIALTKLQRAEAVAQRRSGSSFLCPSPGPSRGGRSNQLASGTIGDQDVDM